MTRLHRPRPRAGLIALSVLLTATVGIVGVAVAKTFTLHVAKNVPVTNTKGVTKHQSVYEDGRSFAVYTLSGDSKTHPKCTKVNGCFKFWPPVKVAAGKKPSAGPGVKGTLGVWHRGGFSQVTLNGHPLYEFAFDKKNKATGEGIVSFGGTWHVAKPASAPKTGTSTAPSAPGSGLGGY